MPAPSRMSTPESVDVPRLPGRARSLAAAAGIALAALAAYRNTFRVPFLFDDPHAILENPGIRHLWPLGRAFWPATPDMTVSGRPVANFTLAINYAISGGDPWSYHALNLLIHLLAGLTLFGVVRRTLLRPGLRGRFGADAFGLAWCTALLWTLHPLQTEAVTYVVQRVESLMGLFFLLTFYCFIRAVEETTGPGSPRARTWSTLAVAACLLGMATKEVTAVAPVLVLLYDRTFVAGSVREAWRRRRGVHLSLAATWLPLLGLVAATGWDRGGTAGFDVGVVPAAYWLTQFPAVARYLALSLWPHPQIFEYGTFWVHRWTEIVPGALVLVPLLVATLTALRHWPAAGFLGAWFFAILAPTSVVPGTIQMIVEHRMYLPVAAVITAVVLGVYAAAGRRSLAAFAALAVGLGALTVRRNAAYRSELALWSDTVAKRPDNARARNGLGVALYHAGRLAEAIENYEIALRFTPRDAETIDNLGVALEHAGRNDEAIRCYETAVRLKPDFPEAYSNLGNALRRAGRLAEAIIQYHHALRLRPDFAETYYNLGGALALAGRTAEAIGSYETALRLRPDYFEARLNLGNVFLGAGRVADAIAQYEICRRLKPADAMTHYDLGLAQERLGHPDAAIAEYTEALRLQPDLPEAHNHLGAALARSGRLPAAIAQLREAVRLRPSFAKAHFNLGNALIADGRRADAIAEYEEALRLQPDYPAARENLARARAGRPENPAGR
jgi:protein O-mannosyl-transferase